MARRSRRGDWITPCDRKLPKGGLLQWPRTVNWFQLIDMEWGWCVTVFACVSARILWVSWCLQKQEMRRERIATAERRRGEIFEVRLVTRVRSFECGSCGSCGSSQGLPQEESVQNKPGLGLAQVLPRDSLMRQFGRWVTCWYWTFEECNLIEFFFTHSKCHVLFVAITLEFVSSLILLFWDILTYFKNLAGDRQPGATEPGPENFTFVGSKLTQNSTGLHREASS